MCQLSPRLHLRAQPVRVGLPGQVLPLDDPPGRRLLPHDPGHRVQGVEVEARLPQGRPRGPRGRQRRRRRGRGRSEGEGEGEWFEIEIIN